MDPPYFVQPPCEVGESSEIEPCTFPPVVFPKGLMKLIQFFLCFVGSSQEWTVLFVKLTRLGAICKSELLLPQVNCFAFIISEKSFFKYCRNAWALLCLFFLPQSVHRSFCIRSWKPFVTLENSPYSYFKCISDRARLEIQPFWFTSLPWFPVDLFPSSNFNYYYSLEFIHFKCFQGTSSFERESSDFELWTNLNLLSYGE